MAALLMWAVTASAAVRNYDVVVYGGTAGGVITALAAAREGAAVALLEPRRHLGGMVSGGLGFTDFGKREVIGGYSLEFFQRIGRRYGKDQVAWYFEPHVAEEVFRELAAEAKVAVFYQHRLRERGGVIKQGTRLIEVRVENGDTFRAKVFVDATYEGDLMARAGVSYTWGREGSAEFGESLAGVREHTPYHQFTVRVSPYGDDGRLLPEVTPRTADPVGAADHRVQAYNFRMCLTNVPENRAPFPRPPGYDPKRYALLARLLKALPEKLGRPLRMSDVMKPDAMPNGKTDVNNNGAFSTDYIGGNYRYPDAGYAERERIWREHYQYVAGFFYFLANDRQVPEELRREMSHWGLAKDEFTDTNNWPHQLYVREARRMRGEFVMSQKDIQTELAKPDAIGMGSYNSDSHNVQRRPTADGQAVENEGDMQVRVTPYQIPYRVMLPRREQATNLLVPVAFSATHVAYSTLRMEPQYMIIGHAAGVAAQMAIAAGGAVQDVDTAALRRRLEAQGVVFEWKPPGGPQR
jgi:hypothetical protein